MVALRYFLLTNDQIESFEQINLCFKDATANAQEMMTTENFSKAEN